jgi:hypothetical protein
MGVVLFACGTAFAVVTPRYPASENILQLATGGFLLAGLCCFGIGLERALGMALLH